MKRTNRKSAETAKAASYDFSQFPRPQAYAGRSVVSVVLFYLLYIDYTILQTNVQYLSRCSISRCSPGVQLDFPRFARGSTAFLKFFSVRFL